MSVRNIPRESWRSFLDAFTRQHHGWLVSVDGSDPEPLEYIRSDGGAIEISAGKHQRLADASAVTVAASDADETAVDHLEIANGNERVTIRFRAAINPELVDGMV